MPAHAYQCPECHLAFDAPLQHVGPNVNCPDCGITVATAKQAKFRPGSSSTSDEVTLQLVKVGGRSNVGLWVCVGLAAACMVFAVAIAAVFFSRKSNGPIVEEKRRLVCTALEARTALAVALDSWVAGDTYVDFRIKHPKFVFVEPEWSIVGAGPGVEHKLLRYKVERHLQRERDLMGVVTVHEFLIAQEFQSPILGKAWAWYEVFRGDDPVKWYIYRIRRE